MLLSLAYLLVRTLLRLLIADRQGEATRDLEIVVLRHELSVLRRQVKRPRFGREGFLVTPKTLLRWHRELVRWKWARYSKRRPSRPPLSAELRELIMRLAKENP